MADLNADARLQNDTEGDCTLALSGDWIQGARPRDFNSLASELASRRPRSLAVDGRELGHWDSLLMAFVLQCHQYCRDERIQFSTRSMPASVDRLLEVATAVPPHRRPPDAATPWLAQFDPRAWWQQLSGAARATLGFIGELGIAFARLLTGRSNTRYSDFRLFVHQAGPAAFGIISLTSVLVGMILAYLGAVQLQQFGAEIFVANLVMVGMLREMGVLMTAVVMAGRTGAAYAAQLGSMQSNEEIDAITTMGISPMEFLVMPRMLALIAVMPLLTLYANLLGILGGAVVAGGMGISPLQYMNQSQSAIELSHLMVGLFKSVIFAILIAVAGCRAGISSGRSSAAVGQATTEAVVTAIVYLIVADAAVNIICQQVGI